MASRRRRFVLYLCAALATLYSLSPIYSLLSVSLGDTAQIVSGQLFPATPTLANYYYILGVGGASEISAQLTLGLANSMIIAAFVMALTIAVCVPAGYALGRLRLRGRLPMAGLLLTGRMLPPIAVALPFYFFFSAVGLRGTIPGIVLLELSLTIPIVTWILMGFFGSLPRDVEQQARADGCSRFQAFRYALLPLAAPGIAASAVIAFLFSWNDFFYSSLITSGTSAQTYNAFLGTLGPSPGSAAAVGIQIVVAIILAGFLQRYINSLRIVDPGTIA